MSENEVSGGDTLQIVSKSLVYYQYTYMLNNVHVPNSIPICIPTKINNQAASSGAIKRFYLQSSGSRDCKNFRVLQHIHVESIAYQLFH